jgi:hypothetical protein
VKRLRPLSLILVLLLSFSFLGLTVSAAGEDFDSDLSNWVVSDPNYVAVNKYSYGNITLFDARFSPIPSDKGFHTGFFYDATNLTAGNSYTLKFKLYNPTQLKAINSAYNAITDSAYYAPFTSYNGALLIGLGSLDSSGNFVFSTTDGTGISINKDNYLSYFGNTVSITFTMPNAVNSAIGIYYIDSAQTGNNCHFYMGQFSLTSNSVDVQAAVDSAIGAVDDMKTELSGKLDEGFDGLLSGIGDLFSNLIDSIGGFFSDLGDSISSGFDSVISGFEDTLTRFGNLFLYLTWDDTPPENPFEKVNGPLDKVEGFFDDFYNYLETIKLNLASVLDSITACIHVFEAFTERFAWLQLLCCFALALLVVSRFVGL